jgi:hypothetical protein
MDTATHKGLKAASGLLLAAILTNSPAAAWAETLQLTLQNHKFRPAEAQIPANQPLTIEITNLDPTPSEFESKTLRVEKVVAGHAKISVQIRPLPPGRYRFFDDYNEDTTEGFLVVK